MFGRPKKYTVVDPKGRPVAEAGPVDAAIWRKKNGPLRVERTNTCSRCGLHNCGGGDCGEKPRRK